jgi:hypothetical protein
MTIGRLLLILVVCLLPVIPLASVDTVFYVDWINHLWLSEYVGAYFRSHLSFPLIINTNTEVGLVFPLFYGEKFYSLAGVLSSQIGAPIAIRVLILLVLVVTAFELMRCIESLRAPRLIALALIAPVLWDTYLLTNLYNRSALTEFFAVLLISCSLASYFTLVFRSAGRILVSDAVRPGLYYALAASFHPITALFGGILVAVLGVCSLIVTRNWKLSIITVISGLLVLLVIAPWLYVTVLFGRSTLIVSELGHLANGYFPGSLDAVWSRLSIIPLDWRAVLNGLDVSTPYLEAQISIPILLMVCFLVVAAWKTGNDYWSPRSYLFIVILAMSLLLFGLTLCVSIAPQLSALFGGLFDIMQFPYRLTAYVNLAALAGAIALIGLIDWDLARSRGSLGGLSVVVAVALTLASSNLVQKLVHAAAVRMPSSAETTRSYGRLVGIPVRSGGQWAPAAARLSENLTDLPGSFYGDIQYRVVRGLVQPASDDLNQVTKVSLAVESTGSLIGQTLPILVKLDRPSLVVTNVQPFPWNRLILDGAIVPAEQVFAVPVVATDERRADVLEALKLDSGKHELRYAFMPDPIWGVLYTLSWIVLVFWIVIASSTSVIARSLGMIVLNFYIAVRSREIIHEPCGASRSNNERPRY